MSGLALLVLIGAGAFFYALWAPVELEARLTTAARGSVVFDRNGTRVATL
ncbi:MAG: hypothetical protein GX493_10980 [Firmicutes bacterium]|nr:hypothetical protein [Bacillota bacterium]